MCTVRPKREIREIGVRILAHRKSLKGIEMTQLDRELKRMEDISLAMVEDVNRINTELRKQKEHLQNIVEATNGIELDKEVCCE